MATAKKAAPVVKKAAPVAVKAKSFAVTTVDKNNYSSRLADLVNNQKATIVAITVSGAVQNSWDVHYTIG